MKRNNMIRVFIVDDHPIVRRGLRELISEEGDLEICGEAANATQALEEMENTQPEVAVIDISLGGTSGIDLIKQVQSKCPRVKILVSSIHDELLFAERALQAGALGYVNKQANTERILQGIRAVAKGDIFMSPQMTRVLMRRMIEGVEDLSRSPVEALSNRELEVFELIGHGMTTREISEKLHVSIKTVETHRQHIKEKLGLDSTTDVIRRAVQWLLGPKDSSQQQLQTKG